jgi:hypothetical protein
MAKYDYLSNQSTLHRFVSNFMSSVTRYKDPFSIQPADNQLCQVRRLIPGLPCVTGFWSAETHSFECGPPGSAWVIQPVDIHAWAALQILQMPVWPVHQPVAKWQDVWFNPPEDGQKTFFRRFQPEVPAQLGTWHAPSCQFIHAETGIQIPWPLIYCWKPCNNYGQAT